MEKWVYFSDSNSVMDSALFSSMLLKISGFGLRKPHGKG